MLKQPAPTLHKTTRPEITSLFGETKLVLDETPKAISPFGGLASFISFLGQIGFARQVQQHLPFAAPTSNNAIPLAHSLTAFLMSVVVGAQRFAHCEWLRADQVLHALLGLERFPSDDTIRNFFLRFSQGHIEAFWRPLWRWLLLLVKCPRGGFALDLDSTVFCREGQQEGARKGFNPRRKGRNSHHPLLAVLAEAQFILHGWLRSGNTGAARGVVPFLQEALALLPAGTWLRTVRADSGFFDGGFLDFLEARLLPYVVVARMNVEVSPAPAGSVVTTTAAANATPSNDAPRDGLRPDHVESGGMVATLRPLYFQPWFVGTQSALILSFAGGLVFLRRRESRVQDTKGSASARGVSGYRSVSGADGRVGSRRRAAVTRGMSATGGLEEAAAPTKHPPGSKWNNIASGKAWARGPKSIFDRSLAGIAFAMPGLRPLGGCRHGIPGLLPLPDRKEIESLTKTSKSYLEKLIANGVVVGLRLLSTMAAARGETFLSGPDLCAALKRGEIKIGEREGE